MLSQNDVIELSEISDWHTIPDRQTGARMIQSLESGKVIYFPHLAFALQNTERRFLSPDCSDGKAKNVSYNPRDGSIQGTSCKDPDRGDLAAMISRFATQARALVESLFPHYAPHLEQARTSYRPMPVEKRFSSIRKDDSRLHVDAFASRPNRGMRILRVFCNINPNGDPRVWNIGEHFENFAPKYCGRIAPQWPGSAWLLEHLGITKGKRSFYDHIMLQLHDRAKMDDYYQQHAAKITFGFPAGSTWMMFSDRVLHAALSGQYLMEQTFNLPVTAMQDESRSPLRILEQFYRRKLA
ncbi:MAG TPA: Kdo hydroxylase family protein [Burkholderiales bacterium]|nr:Kdo hydroxylase family protein [Burkholderiales bacterium]